MQVETIDEVDLKLRLFSSFEVCDLIAILVSIHQPINYVVFFQFTNFHQATRSKLIDENPNHRCFSTSI